MKRMVAVLSAGAMVAGMLGASTSGAASAAPRGALSGQLQGRDGAPLAGATVTVSLLPPGRASDGAVVPKVLGTATTDDLGRYVVEELPPGLVDHAGPLELLVTGAKGTQAVDYNFTAGEEATVSGVEGGSIGLGQLDLQLGEGPTSDLSLLASTGDPGDETGPEPIDPDGSTPATPYGATNCYDTYQPVFVPNYNVTKRRMIPINRLSTLGHSKMDFTYSSTSRTDLSGAWTGDGGDYAGGLEASRSNSSGLGMRHEVGNQTSELLKVEWEYVRWRKKCAQPFSGGDSYWLDVYWWRAERKTSGSGTPNSEPVFTCTDAHTVLMSADTWVAKESSQIYSAYFSLAGSSMKAQQEHSEGHKLTVYPDNGEVRAKICGDEDLPVAADRIKELPNH